MTSEKTAEKGMLVLPTRSAHSRNLSNSPSFLAAFVLSLTFFVPVAGYAQAPAPREDEAMTQARQAYDNLPAADRRAIQDNMVWAGIYKGIVDGEFGRMTFNAMRTYTARRPGAAEGILGPPDRAALAAEAAKARAAVEFRIVQEPRAGISIGIPQKVFVRRSDAGTGARFETSDKTAGVETFGMKEGEASLQALYDSYRAPAPNRRVTYSVIRPDFIVVAAETPTRASYTRVARGAAAGENLLRGFTISWPKAQQARYEILSVAIANAFDPFGQKAVLAKVPDGKPLPSGGKDGVQPSGAMIAPQPRLTSSAIAFAPNRYVAILPGAVCRDARIGTRAARLLRQDPATGLTLFDVPGGTGIRLRASAQAPESKARAVVIFASAGEPKGGASIAVGTGELPELAAGAKEARVRAPLPAEASGGLVLSRQGELYGLVAPVRGPQQIAGAPPPASREMLMAESLGAFIAASGLEFVPAQPNAPDASAGKIAADTRGSIEALWCADPAGTK